MKRFWFMLGLAGLFLSGIATAGSDPPKELTLFDTHGGANWQELYLTDLFPEFERQTGIKIRPTWTSFIKLEPLLESWAEKGRVNADLLILHPSNAARLIQEGRISLTAVTEYADQIPNLAHVNPQFFGEIGGAATHGKAIPQWINAYGFLYNFAKINPPPASFRQLHDWALDGKFSDRRGGHIGLISPAGKSAGGRKFIWLFLHAYGCSFRFLNQPDPADPKTWIADPSWEPGWSALREMVDAGAFFTTPLPTTGAELFAQYLEEKVWGGVYAIDYFLWAMEQGRVPETSATSKLAEGTVLSSSYWVIPERAPHRPAAFQFLNFMLSEAFQTKQFQKQWLYPAIIGPIHNKLPPERYGTLTPTWKEISAIGAVYGPPEASAYIQAVALNKLGLAE